MARSKTRRQNGEMKLGRSFYDRPAEELARALLGKVLVRHIGRKMRRARIVETEAYVGPEDLACHSSRGRTGRTEVMFGPAGHAYVYLIYGMYHMLNITCGHAQAVLLRAAEPLDGWRTNLSGPGRLARGFRIARQDNALDLTHGELYLTGGEESPLSLQVGPRIGVDYADHWKDAMLRFCDARSPAVSRPRR